MQILKADGTYEPFRPEKLKRSLRKAGAVKEEIDAIVHEIELILHDGMRTQEIYRHAFTLLRETELPAAARYSLRRALFNLGPTGFPFEDFLARLFEAEGYATKTRVTLQGKCAEHELDIAAYKQDHSFLVEAKFHSRPGVKSDLQVALYSYARFVDLIGTNSCTEDTCGVTELWVVTNTKFTSTAEKYAECCGLNLLSWDYPRKGNLHDRIRDVHLYPVTVLQSLTSAQKQSLIKRGVIVCRDLVAKPHMLRHAHLSARKTEAVLSEARQLCQ